jgi:hypothetical protein
MRQPAPFNYSRKTDFYAYQTFSDGLAATLSETTNITIRAHADFVIHKLTMFADLAGAVQTDSSRVLPLITLQITDTGSGKQFFSDDIPIPALFGSGTLPFILPGPRIVAANSTLQFTFTNYSSATTYNTYLALIGVEVYRDN